jgi:L,D-peptidoglycan transpeptidase YkuD (ErfK/YbiS/YcfS/YnhG family)
MRLTLICFLIAVSASLRAGSLTALPSDCRQCLVVTTDSWSAPRGQLMAFARGNGSGWRQRGAPVPVLIGDAGMAWGRGILRDQLLPGPQKREGDHRAPAGLFYLGSAFGYAPVAPATRLPYLPLSRNIVAVDDPQSRYYNQVLDQSKIRRPDWRSAEKMILGDVRYKWGMVVRHNFPPVPGAGSCIFLHVWKSPETTTVGCTAMPEAAVLDLMQWLDPAQHPVLIQLPSPIYSEWRARWHLPGRDS